MENVYSRDLKGEPKCGVCQRASQFVPVRIAVVLDKQISMEADQDYTFEPPDSVYENFPILPRGLKYILRRLDQGYIYTYSDSWRFSHFNDTDFHMYQVNETGYIDAVDKDEISDFKPATYKCFQSATTSRNVGINEAFGLDLYVYLETNSKINIVYTRHQLSPLTLEKLADNKKYRDRFMPAIDIKNGSDNLVDFENFHILENIEKLKEASKLVPWETDFVSTFSKSTFKPPEFATEESVRLQAYKTDNYGKVLFDKNDDPIPIEGEFEDYKVVPDDRIIILDDPIGIVEDTLSIINYLAEKIKTPEEERLYQSALQIIKLKGLVKAKIHSEKYSELWETNSFRYGAENMLDGISEQDKTNIHVPIFPSQDEAEKALESFEEIQANMMRKKQHYMENFFDFDEKDIIKLTKEVNKEFEEEWSKKSLLGLVDSFSDKVKEKEMRDWLEQQVKKAIDYTQTTIEPVIKFYLEWLKSDILLNYMDNAFDHQTPFSGNNFIEISSRIFGNADTLELCSSYFAELLKAVNFNNPKNYLLRTFTFDSKTLQENVNSVNDFLGKNQVTTLSFAGAQFFDESTIEQHKNYQNQVQNIKSDIKVKIDLFSEQIGGTVARVFHGHANKGPNAVKTVAMKSFEVFSGKTLTSKAYSGKLKDVIKQIMQDSSVNFNEAESRQIKKNAKNVFKVNLQKALLENFNTDIDFHRLGKMRTKVYMILHLDTQQLAKINPNMSNAQISEVMRGAVRVGGQVIDDAKVAAALEESTRLSQLEGQKQNIFARKNTGLGFGVFALSLQTLALVGATQGVATGINAQTGVTFVGVIAATFGNVADVMDRQLQMKIAQMGQNSILELRQAKMVKIARFNLYGGAILLATVEILKGYDAWKKDQYEIMGAYGMNAFVVFMTTRAFLNSSTLFLRISGGYWGLILIGVSIVISYGIDQLKKREIRNFLESSAWGVKTQNWATSTEKAEFEKIYE